MTSCPRCKNFGPKLMNALLAPITRARPFDLLCGDYLSLPVGTGGFKTVLLFVDVYSRFTFGFMTRSAGTGSFTVDCLDQVSNVVMSPASFMSDNGSHFDCKEVDDWAARNGTTIIHSPAYTPSVNGLVEDANKILLGRLRTLCATDVGESQTDDGRPASPPARSWPKFLQTAIRQMNDRILPSLGYSPRELMTGILTADRKYQVGASIRQQHSPSGSLQPTPEVDVNLALAYALRADGAERALIHAKERKRLFDRKVWLLAAAPGDLVQKYNPRWDNTHSTERKQVPKWSDPLRIRERRNTSYVLENLDGGLVSPSTHARHLRKFLPRPGSALAQHLQCQRALPVPQIIPQKQQYPELETIDGEPWMAVQPWIYSLFFPVIYMSLYFQLRVASLVSGGLRPKAVWTVVFLFCFVFLPIYFSLVLAVFSRPRADVAVWGGTCSRGSWGHVPGVHSM